MKAKEAVFSRRDAETQREVLDRINRIDGSGDSHALQSNLDTPTHENPALSSFTVAQTRRQCLGERRKQGKRDKLIYFLFIPLPTCRFYT